MKHTTAPRLRAPRFDREWTEMINLLPESRREILTKAIREYQLTMKEPTDLEGAETMAFLLIKKIVDRRSRLRKYRMRKREEASSLSRQPQPQTQQQSALYTKAHPAVKSQKRTVRKATIRHKNQNKKSNPHDYLRLIVDRHKKQRSSFAQTATTE
ncbi:MAG: DUF6291 domain-containing protein [Muribaculum sp.]|nr:DUF6291 domain-containing protein [Muribaculum sp.]